MLRELDLKSKLDKEEWERISPALKTKLSVLQQKAKAVKIPVVIVFEGWGASGKGGAIARLIAELDPRGFSVHSIAAPNEQERRFPWMRRFWEKLPLYGDFAIFDRSWYREATNVYQNDRISHREIGQRLKEIQDFEQQITDDGYLLLKFFLHISAKEQKRRFERLEAQKETRWRVTEQDWRQNERYEQYLDGIEQVLAKTDCVQAKWIPIAATDHRYAAWRIYTTVIDALEREIDRRGRAQQQQTVEIRVSPDIVPLPAPRLAQIELKECTMDKEAYQKELKRCQKKLSELHNRLYLKKIPLIVGFEGWDAAGKGGAIKRLSRALDPRGYEVVPVAAPSTVEKNHQHLWRFWNALPKDGHIAIFDRTWYGRVMVEQIEGFCTKEQWARAYDEINRFELSLADWGAVILKFWLQIDKEEQLRRFNDRQNTPQKRYKITDEDWRNREKWPEYERAVDEMLLRTNTQWAPWTVVEANDKRFARIKVLHTVIEAVQARL